ncbi:hypothetical protein FSP39_006377 [Pinctada imbricata]|uniref:Bromodomain associated domain-containing protein n=1 Tax=Pinctada imbricata TaxID=66713 RepID=A0AA88Y7H3_PINIB|nr:hypothetical protein FSP39_006377 [Pinctada imbricata]
MMDIHALWGENEIVTESEKMKERREPIKLQPLDVEGPRLHQPSSRHQPPTNDLLPSEWFESDPVVLHTIKLLQHMKKLKQMIQTVQQQQESSTDPDTVYPAAPPIPEYKGPTIKHKVVSHLPYLVKDCDSNFVRGVGEIPPVIDETACRKLLKKSTAIICAHLGFDTCSEITMDTLSDVMHEYFQELCKHLRTAAHHALLTGCSGFPDIVEKTFHEMGIGSVTSLNEFYHTRVLNYKINMESTCQNLMSEYEKLIQPSLIKQQDPDNVPVIRIKEEPSSEIQFPVLDENDELNDAEQLLYCIFAGLGGFEITVEHESASGLTTEVESKWSKEGVKPEVAESSDIVEKTFHEMGIGSVTSLNEFYHTRVLNYKINMESTCQNLMSEYEKLIQPSLIKQQDPDNVPVIRIKEEPSSEIQFPVLDENDELNDAEQLLQLEGLGGFEITVEHESASGLTTEVESKWSKEGVKPEVAESSVSSTRVSTLDDFDDPGSTKERPPDTPAQLSEGDSINDPGSVTDIMSPPSISKPSKSKKRYSYM